MNSYFARGKSYPIFCDAAQSLLANAAIRWASKLTWRKQLLLIWNCYVYSTFQTWKVRANLSSCLTNFHAINKYGEMESSTILDPDTRCKWRVRFRLRPSYSREKRLVRPFNRRPGELQRRYRQCEEKTVLLLSGVETAAVQPLASPYTAANNQFQSFNLVPLSPTSTVAPKWAGFLLSAYTSRLGHYITWTYVYQYGRGPSHFPNTCVHGTSKRKHAHLAERTHHQIHRLWGSTTCRRKR